MHLEPPRTPRKIAAPVLQLPTYRPAHKPGGWVVIHPQWEAILRDQKLLTACDFLDFPGEIVSGHPDRHVMRVELADHLIGYLKREHRIPWQERFKNRRDGFGWASKSTREACFLQQLENQSLPLPQWMAYGEDGRGRAFLLLREVPDAVDLRMWLQAHPDAIDRQRMMERVALLFAQLHQAGIDHPDLYAKHLLINPQEQITLLDWQRSTVRTLTQADRFRSIATLNATLADSLANTALRVRFFRRYQKHFHVTVPSNDSGAIPILMQQTRELLQRRGIREQRQDHGTTPQQRLVWLNGEAFCAIPEIAAEIADWERRLYDPTLNHHTLRFGPLSPQREARLFNQSYPAHFRRWWQISVRKSWRAEELRIARLLFHLERFQIPAPRLLAFGQRPGKWGKAEAFVLFEPFDPSAVPFRVWFHALCHAEAETAISLRHCVLNSFGDLLRKLHEAGCALADLGPRGQPFVVKGQGVDYQIGIADVRALRFQRKLSAKERVQDLRWMWQQWTTSFQRTDLVRFLMGYCQSKQITPEMRRIVHEL